MIRDIELYSCCIQRSITVSVNVDNFEGEAWRLARVLKTTSYKVRDNGVAVISLHTNLELAMKEWEPEKLRRVLKAYGGEWGGRKPVIDWKFSPLHWVSHSKRPINIPETQILDQIVFDWFNNEALRIREAGGTVYAAGDRSIAIVPGVATEEGVVYPNEQLDAETQRMLRALFGGE